MQSHPTSGAEPDAQCPVSLDVLGAIYRADEYDLPLLLAELEPLTRAKLAAFCYRKSHTHQLGLKIARACERDDLLRAAGEIGAVIHGQAHLKRSAEPAPVAVEGPRRGAKPAPAPKKISLGGSAAKGRTFD
jgi:hypothetical protein